MVGSEKPNNNTKKTGDIGIAYVYNRSEKYQLIQQADEYNVPLKLVLFLQEEGYDIEPDVTFHEEIDGDNGDG